MLLFVGQVAAQDNSVLYEKVSLKVDNQSFASVFKLISKQVSIQFSYSDFPANERLTYRCENKTLAWVLNDILSPKYSYVLRGNYIIIKSMFEEAEIRSKPEVLTIRGKVFDDIAKKPLADVSVFDPQSKNSCLTDSKGNFTLRFASNYCPKNIHFSKLDFQDAVVPYQGMNLSVYLLPDSIFLPVRNVVEFPNSSDTIIGRDSISTVSNSTPEIQALKRIMRQAEIKTLESWNRIQRRNLNYKNINDTLFSNLAFSIFPPFSTNKLLGLNTVNKYAFHLFVGNSKGIERLEFAGFMNLDAGDVRYFQLAGIQNWVKGRTTGFQLAGIGNTNLGGIAGFQLGGIYNLNLAPSSGVQVAGITSINLTHFEGVQISGIYNQITSRMAGFQLAGICNEADTIIGTQLSGIVNRANFVQGSQISLLNFADSMQGIPIGLFSYVRTGYHKIELAYDDIGMASLSFRTGVNAFHTIFSFGVIPAKNTKIFSLGYGIGTALKMQEKWYVNIDLTGQTIQDRSLSLTKNLSMLSRCFVGFEYRPWKKTNFVFGPTLNLLYSDLSYFKPVSVSSSLTKYPVENHFGSEVYKSWIGFKVGVRFL